MASWKSGFFVAVVQEQYVGIFSGAGEGGVEGLDMILGLGFEWGIVCGDGIVVVGGCGCAGCGPILLTILLPSGFCLPTTLFWSLGTQFIIFCNF